MTGSVSSTSEDPAGPVMPRQTPHLGLPVQRLLHGQESVVQTRARVAKSQLAEGHAA